MVGGREKSGASGIVVSLAVAITVLAAVSLTVLGRGVTDKLVAVYNGSSWVWSSRAGELSRINGLQGSVDTRAKIKDSQGHEVHVTQNDRYLIIRDLVTGKISSLDLSTLQVAASMDSPPGYGVSLALHDDVAFIIDGLQGVVRQVDPLTLNPSGRALQFPPGLRGGGFDAEGRYWLAVPSEGTVIAVRPGRKGADPTVAATIPAASPQHDLSLSILDDGVAVLDHTAAALVTVRGDVVKSIALPAGKPGAVPGRATGPEVPVTVSDDQHLYVIARDTVRDVQVHADQGRALQPAVAWAGWFYVADTLGDLVYVVDGQGNPIDRLRIKDGVGLQLEVRNEHLFINPPNGDTATVVDAHHRPTPVPKFPNGVPGGDPLTPPTPPPSTPPPPTPTTPGTPGVVTAVAGNASATVSWGAAKDNLAPITQYVIEGGPRPVTVGGGHRTAVVPGLVNGTTYTFTVHGVNAKGAGPKRTSNPVTPTREVPDPPAAVTAREAGDGTVTLRWAAANGQGHRIVKYAVTAISAGPTGGANTAETVIGESATTELILPDGTLTYGTQYAFTVAAVNELNARSGASALSNTVVPYTKPGTVTELAAAADSGKPGTITVHWAAAADNGRAVTAYVVTANGGRRQEVTGTAAVLDRFGEGETVRVEVRAVNVAGEGRAATAAATTIKKPAITGGNPSSGPFSVAIPFTVNNGGSPTTCWVEGAVSGNGSCTGYNLGNLRPGTGYPFTVHARNAAGEVTWSSSVTTAEVWGTVCPDCSSIEVKTQPCYQNPDGGNTGPGCANAGVPNSAHVADAHPGGRYSALCKRSTQVISSAGHRYNRRSNVWIKVNAGGAQGWIPWAWFTLDGDDGTMHSLPAC